MTTCDYCGKPSDDTLDLCPQCGTELPPAPGALPKDAPPPILPMAPPPLSAPLPPPDPGLTAGRATKILLAYIGVQILMGIVLGVVAVFMREQDEQTKLALFGSAMIISLVAAAWVGWRMARKYAGPDLYDSTPTGACWVRGSWGNILQGLVVGAILGSCYLALAFTFMVPDADQPAGPLATMADTPGLPRLIWFILALLLAPPIEELLFRGVIFAGFNRSFGLRWAATLTTAIFAILHVGEAIYFPLAFLTITAMALAALWFRLRSAALGPAIALHFGYNAMLALAILTTT